MAHSLDLLLIVLFVVVWPLLGRFVQYPRLKAAVARGDREARRRSYRLTIIEQWILATAAITLWVRGGRPLANAGLAIPHDWRFAVGLVAGVAMVAFLHHQRRAAMARPALLARLGVSLRETATLVPHTASEYRLWIPLSVTAGICEEILYRGYLTGWLAPTLGSVVAPVVATALFGLAHIYLGRTGAVRALAAGAVMAVFAAFTGTLWVSMFLHAAIDLHSGRLCYEALREDRSTGEPAPGLAARAS